MLNRLTQLYLNGMMLFNRNSPICGNHLAAAVRRPGALFARSWPKCRRFSQLGLSLICSAFMWTSVFAADAFVPDQVLVQLQPGASIDSINATWGTITIEQIGPESYLLRPAAGVTVLDCDADLDLDLDIAGSDPNYILESPEAESAIIVVAIGSSFTEYVDQGAFDRIGLPQAHTISTGQGMTIAILDTGIDPAHPLFAGKLSPAGYDFVQNDADPTETSNGIDEDLDGLIDEGFGHGTMVAGIVAATAPGAVILPIRVLDDDGFGTLANLIKGIEYAVSQGADIINLSVGLSAQAKPLELAGKSAWDAGAMLVGAAGNSNTDTSIVYPASFNKVISVGAVDSTDVKAAFSNYNDEINLVSPGDGIYSSYPGGLYAQGSGTSFAVPFVSGALALLREMAPQDSLENARSMIYGSASPIDQIPANEPYDSGLGDGRLSVYQAVLNMQNELATGVETGLIPVRGSRIFAAPNPFRGNTSILFELDGNRAASALSLAVFDIRGRLVRELKLIDAGGAGRRVAHWDGLDHSGNSVAAGRYLVRGRQGGQVSTGSILRVK